MSKKKIKTTYLTLFVYFLILLSIFINSYIFIILLLTVASIAVYYHLLKKQNNNKMKIDTNIIDEKYINLIKVNIGDMIKKVKYTMIFLVVLLAVLSLVKSMIVIIPAGQTGVYHIFGKVYDKELKSGLHFINPLASVEKMSIQTEQYTMSIAAHEGKKIGNDSIEALTKEGLKVHLDITVLYHLIEDRASDVYQEIGVNYDEKILRPEVRTAIRDIIALYEAKDIYSDKREEAVQRIQDKLSERVNKRGIKIESVLLRNVSLPVMLTNAIESKLTAEQDAQRYDFILKKEEKEAERKRIEAQGQKDAQSIIDESLTDKYIQYLYVKNLEKRTGTIYVPYDMPLLKGL